MGLIKSLIERFVPRNKVISAIIPAWESGVASSPPHNVDSLVRRYQGDVYSCVSLISSELSAQKLRLYIKKNGSKPLKTKTIKLHQSQASRVKSSQFSSLTDEVEEVVEHPFIEMMRKVNPFWNASDLLEAYSVYISLTGMFFAYIVKNDFGVPVELWPLPPERMHAVKNQDTLISYWEYWNGSERIRFETDEIWYQRTFSPLDQVYGFSALMGTIKAADLSSKIWEYEYNLLNNRAVPDLLVSVDGPLNETNQDRIFKSWKNRYGGNNIGSTAIIGDGVKVEKLSFTPDEMGHVVGSDKARDRICNAFRVPKQLLTSDDVNRANLDGGIYSFQRFCIKPILLKLEQSINQNIIPLYDDSGAFFCAFDENVPEDKDYKLRERQANIQTGYTTINEERAANGLQPLDWGNDPPAPQNMGSYALQDSKLDDLGAKGYRPIAKISNDPGDQPKARNFEATLKSIFERQKKEVIGNIKSLGVGVTKDDREQLMSGLFSVERWNKIISTECRPFIERMIIDGFDGGKGQMSAVGVSFNIPPKDAIRFLQTYTIRFSDKFASSVNLTTLDAIKFAIADGLEAGEGISGIKKRIFDVYSEADEKRASVIARTETKRALEAGHVASYEAAGVKQMEWLADDDACEFCAAVNGKIVEVGSIFESGKLSGADGGIMSLDYGPVEYPPLHPNCECALIPVIE